MKKRFMALLLAVLFVISAFPVGAIAAEAPDMPTDWAQKPMQAAMDNGLITGDDRGYVHPNGHLSRAEMAAILVRAFGAQKKTSLLAFTDVDLDSWYAEDIAKAIAMGALNGDGNGKMRPNAPITRQECITAVYNMLRLAPGNADALKRFADAAEVSAWAEGALSAMVNAGYISGVGNKILPNMPITRAECAQLMLNIIPTYVTPSNATGNYEGNVLVRTSGITLKNMNINGDLIIADGVAEGDIKVDNVKVQGRILVRGGGKNSVYFNNVTVGGAVIVKKTGDSLRIVATGSTSASVVRLESGAIIVTKEIVGGGFDRVEIPKSVADGLNIVLDGNFKLIENNATGTELSVTGKVGSLVLNEKTQVSGTAAIDKITTAPGADSVVNGKPVAGGQDNAKPDTAVPPPSSGGGIIPTEKTVTLTLGCYYGVTNNGARKYIKADGTLTADLGQIAAQSADRTIKIDVDAVLIQATPITSEIQVAGYDSSGSYLTSNGPTIEYDAAGGIWIITKNSAHSSQNYELVLPWSDGDTMLGSKENSRFAYAVPDRSTGAGPFYAYGYTDQYGQGERIPYGTDAPAYGNLPCVHVGMYRENDTVTPLTTIYTPYASSRTFVFAGNDGTIKTLTVTDQVNLSGTVTISGASRYGTLISADSSNVVPQNLSYQWQRADTENGAYANINGAIAASYTLAAPDIGKYVRVKVTSSDAFGSVVSAPTAAVEKVQLAISAPGIAPKVYDGRAEAGVPMLGTVSGKLIGDDVTVVGMVSALNSANVGIYTVTVSYTLLGEAAGCYIAPAENTNLSAYVTTKQADAFAISAAGGQFITFDIIGEDVGTLTPNILSISFGGNSITATDVSAYAGGKYTVTVPQQTADGVKSLSVTMTGPLVNHTPYAQAITMVPTATPTEKYTVTFNSNGGSPVSAISNINAGDTIEKPSDPAKMAEDGTTPLDFIGWFKDAELTLAWDFAADKVNVNITLYAKWSGWQAPIDIDARFAEGYPKASVNKDGKIVLKVKLTQPGQVFALVNQGNYGADITVESVIHGHALLNGTKPIGVDSAPFIYADTAELEYTFETWVKVYGRGNIEIPFVIRDADGSNPSAKLTSIIFTGKAVAALDTVAPTPSSVYLNKAADKIYIYFSNSDPINVLSVPTPSDFTLSNGTVTAIDSVTNNLRNNTGRVVLSVNGISNTSNLTLSYSGTALRDCADTPNTVLPWIDKEVTAAAPRLKSFIVSNDGQYVSLLLDGRAVLGTDTDIAFSYGATEETAVPILESDYTLLTDIGYYDYSAVGWQFKLNTLPTLTSGHKFFATYTSASVDGAGDSVVTVKMEAEPQLLPEANIRPKSVVYDGMQGNLIITFPEGHGLSGSFTTCLLTLSNEGKNYTLRGWEAFTLDTNQINIFLKYQPIDLAGFNWSGATLGYSLSVHGGAEQLQQYLEFSSGKPYEGFSDASVTVK